MPWWSWVLIWTVLVLLLLGVLALNGWILFRKAMTAARALGELLEKTSLLEAAGEELRDERFTPSVLRPIDEVRREHAVRSSERAERRERRRELRLQRGRLLTSAEATRRVVNDAR